MSTYKLFTLKNVLPHNLIKETLTELIDKLLIWMSHFIWLVIKNVFCILLNTTKQCGEVRKIVLYSIILKNIFIVCIPYIRVYWWTKREKLVVIYKCEN